MEKTVYNPQKGRLETIKVEITAENTTWFEDNRIEKITDLDGCLLIQEFGYNYPFLIYDVTRKEIDYNVEKAFQLLDFHK